MAANTAVSSAASSAVTTAPLSASPSTAVTSVDTQQMIRMALNLRLGLNGVTKDVDASHALFKRAAELDDIDGVVGVQTYGIGCPENNEKVREYAEIGAAKGRAFCQFQLGYLYDFGLGGLAVDKREALRLYELAAAQGIAGAQYNAAVMHDESAIGVPKNGPKAFHYYSLAAAQQYASALNAIGFVNGNPDGYGVTGDRKKALQCYRAAAERGSTIAPHNIGLAYQYSRGTDKHLLKALEWHQLSSLRGNNDATASLGVLRGMYCPPDD